MAWQLMFLGWYREGLDGSRLAMPARGYTWNETPALNRAIWRRHCRATTRHVFDAFERSY